VFLTSTPTIPDLFEEIQDLEYALSSGEIPPGVIAEIQRLRNE
jgi:hypothetical protein